MVELGFITVITTTLIIVVGCMSEAIGAEPSVSKFVVMNARLNFQPGIFI
jgi:hypothetical protein